MKVGRNLWNCVTFGFCNLYKSLVFDNTCGAAAKDLENTPRRKAMDGRRGHSGSPKPAAR
jgi:hypothetical protein